MVSTNEVELLKAFIASEYAPDGEWWIGVPVGFEMGNAIKREIDAVCITSRKASESDPFDRTRAEEWSDESRDEGWLEGEEVTLVEAKSSGGTWRALGQLLVYQEMFEMDWNVTVNDSLIVADESVPGEDSKRLFGHILDQADLFLYDDEFREAP